jgi:hypothetical protein
MGSFDGGLVMKFLIHYILYSKSILLYASNPMHKDLFNSAKELKDLGAFALT